MVQRRRTVLAVALVVTVLLIGVSLCVDGPVMDDKDRLFRDGR